MIERIYLLLEIVAYLLIINNLYDKKFKFDFPAIFTIATEVIIFRLTNEGIISAQFRIIPYVLLVLYVYIEFKSSLKKLIINMLVTVLVIGGMQVLFSFMTFFIFNEDIRVLVINSLLLCLCLVISKYPLLVNILKFVEENKIIMYILHNCIIIFIATIIYFKVFDKFSVMEYILLLTIYIIICILIFIWKEEKEQSLHKDAEIQEIVYYGEVERKTIKQIRRRQHDFKNQINALYSTHYTSNSLDELIKKQKQYAEWLLEENIENEIIINCNTSVIAGFIISKFRELKNQGIYVKSYINISEIKNIDLEYDLIRVLGILIDNAVEARETSEITKYINCFFKKAGETISISIQNRSEFIDYNEIKKFFVEGYSTKGNGRGYGLNTVNDIIKKYRGSLIVNNFEKENENWISFELELLDE